MKILPISSSYQQNNRKQNTNFKGEFIKTATLDNIMRYSSPESLKRFTEIVEQIKKVPDNLFFWVNTHYSEYETQGPDIGISHSYYLFKQEGKDTKTKDKLEVIYDDITPSVSRLTEINKKLEQIYEGKITSSNRQELIDKINGFLVQNKPFSLKDNRYGDDDSWSD